MPIVRRGGYGGGKSTLIIDNTAAGGKRYECNTMTCAHCGINIVLADEYNAAIFRAVGISPVLVRDRPRNRCDRCARYICDAPACKAECNFVEEMLELALAHPGAGPFLARGPGGTPLFDPRLRDRRRIAGVGFSAPAPKVVRGSG